MIIKINATELASHLAHQHVIALFGVDALFEDVIEEYVGRRYKPAVQGEFNKAYDLYWDKIFESTIYPFAEGETYYTIELLPDLSHQIIESCWDYESEQMYKNNPALYFKSKEDAEQYLKEKTSKQSNESTTTPTPNQ